MFHLILKIVFLAYSLTSLLALLKPRLFIRLDDLEKPYAGEFIIGVGIYAFFVLLITTLMFLWLSFSKKPQPMTLAFASIVAVALSGFLWMQFGP